MEYNFEQWLRSLTYERFTDFAQYGIKEDDGYCVWASIPRRIILGLLPIYVKDVENYEEWLEGKNVFLKMRYFYYDSWKGKYPTIISIDIDNEITDIQNELPSDITDKIDEYFAKWITRT